MSLVFYANDRTASLREKISSPELFVGPKALDLDLRVEIKSRGRGMRRYPEFDGESVEWSGKSKFQGYRVFPRKPLNRMNARLHLARKILGTRPERRLQPALGRQRLHDPALRDIGEQS